MTVYVFKRRDLQLTRPHKTRHPVGKSLDSYDGKLKAHKHQQVNIGSHVMIYPNNYHTCPNTQMQVILSCYKISNHSAGFTVYYRVSKHVTGFQYAHLTSNIQMTVKIHEQQLIHANDNLFRRMRTKL